MASVRQRTAYSSIIPDVVKDINPLVSPIQLHAAIKLLHGSTKMIAIANDPQSILTKPISSTVRLTNASMDKVYFHVQAASSDLQIRPNSGILKSGEKEEITVFWKPMEWNCTDVLRDRIIIKSTRMYNGQSFDYEDGQPNSFDNCQTISMTPILTELADLRREVRRLQLPDSCSRCRGSLSATRAELNQLRDELEQLKVRDRRE
ncbi:unnamed protein product [Dicrocoelium dendriticum]|nr:unnamed protein product [Dicrocoelium dendriticum]